MTEKNPGVAAVLSFLVPGLGQIYNGQLLGGIGLFLLYGFSIALMIIVIGFITTPILWILGIIDAYKQANKLNENNRVA